MGKAHDVHGLHCLLEVVFVLLAWNWDVTIGQKTIVVESFQKQIRCEEEKQKNILKKHCSDIQYRPKVKLPESSMV